MGNTAQGVLIVVGSTSLLCILGSHLLINLKDAAERGLNEGTKYRPDTVSGLNFGTMRAKGVSGEGRVYPPYRRL